MKYPLCILLALVVVAASCSSPAAPEYDLRPTYLNEVGRGWNFFGSGNFGLANESFRLAEDADEDRQWPEAHIGLGWSLAMLDSLTRSISNFNTALGRQPLTFTDSMYIYAGLSLAYRDAQPPNYSRVVSNGKAALAIDPDFVLEHRTSINSADLEAVMAEAYFNMAAYDSAAYIVDPDSLLDWSAADFHSVLLAEINTMINLSREGQ